MEYNITKSILEEMSSTVHKLRMIVERDAAELKDKEELRIRRRKKDAASLYPYELSNNYVEISSLQDKQSPKVLFNETNKCPSVHHMTLRHKRFNKQYI